MFNRGIILLVALISLLTAVNFLLLNFPIRQKKVSIFLTNRKSLKDSIATQNVGSSSKAAAEPFTMANAFNFSKCLNVDKLRVYIYPTPPDVPQSRLYSDILKVIRKSAYFTNDQADACLFIPSVDTTDRDRISPNYIKDLNSHLSALPRKIWADGLNHLIFNFYFGTYPNYANNDLGFDPGKAMLAWTSSNRQNFRHAFDISLPLFHAEHPLKDGDDNQRGRFLFDHPGRDQLLANFKGKRYVYGIGSETRDILHHLHQNSSIVIATTCRHNSDWKKFEDDRCAVDNAEYDRWDYSTLMANSTFCLIPRGRRLGSFRFLESLGSGCIPVILSDDWVLPFEEMLDWSEAAIFGNERSVLFIYDYLVRIADEDVFRMRQFGQMLYQRHFASVERIILSTIEMIFERIRRHLGMPPSNWMCPSNS